MKKDYTLPSWFILLACHWLFERWRGSSQIWRSSRQFPETFVTFHMVANGLYYTCSFLHNNCTNGRAVVHSGLERDYD
jgi:hypothetical protein